MENTNIQSKILIHEESDEASGALREFFKEKGLQALKDNSRDILELLQSNTDLGAVLISESFTSGNLTGVALAEKIHSLRPDLPIFIRKDAISDEELSTSQIYEVFTLNDLDRLDRLLDELLFSRYYPIPLIRGIQEVSQSAISSCIYDVEVSCEPPYLIKDNVIYGELLSLIPLESEWCRGYMMLQTTKAEILKIIKAGKTAIDKEELDISAINSLLNEMTNLIWGGIRSRLLTNTAESADGVSKAQVPILVNHAEKYISFGTTEPQLSFKYTVRDKNDNEHTMIMYQKLVFNLDWRPESFKETDQTVNDLVDSGELELF